MKGGNQVSRWLKEKKIVMEAAQRMLAKGLVIGTAGNVSLRLPPEGNSQLLAITPSALPYDSLSVDDIQIIDFNTRTVEGSLRPSTEMKLHMGIYRAREEINAVIHTHSVFASAVSITGKDIPPILNDQVAFLGGTIKLAEYAPAGSQELATNAVSALEDRNAVLLANHGAVGIGRTMDDAFTACELIEKTAKIYLLALSTGTVNHLPDIAIEAEKAYYDMLRKESE
jgi:L-ribulose-5-phosphate 4-epimerase